MSAPSLFEGAFAGFSSIFKLFIALLFKNALECRIYIIFGF